jgi:hypothetical protein
VGQKAFVTVKKFTYRNADEEFSNKWHLSAVPTTQDEMDAFTTAWANLEKAIYASNVSIVRAYAYANDDNPASFVRDLVPGALTVPGTYNPATNGDEILPGDAAATVRWYTGRTSTRGKKIYLRKYFHGVYRGFDAEPDKVATNQVTAYGTFATALEGSVGAISAHIVGPDGVAPLNHRVDPYITTRTLKRRGRRPPT